MKNFKKRITRSIFSIILLFGVTVILSGCAVPAENFTSEVTVDEDFNANVSISLKYEYVEDYQMLEKVGVLYALSDAEKAALIEINNAENNVPFFSSDDNLITQYITNYPKRVAFAECSANEFNTFRSNYENEKTLTKRFSFQLTNVDASTEILIIPIWIGYDAQNQGEDPSHVYAYSPLITRYVQKKSLEVQQGITTIPEVLQQQGIDSEEIILERFFQAIANKAEGYELENILLYDVIYKISNDGETTWEEVSANNFPEGGVVVTIPYPEGTNKENYDFVIGHMITVANNELNPGDIEFPEVTKNDDGLQFTAISLSPISISWKLSESNGNEPGNEGNESGNEPGNEGNGSDVEEEKGDVDAGQPHNVNWTLLMVLGFSGVVATGVVGKKVRKVN